MSKVEETKNEHGLITIIDKSGLNVERINYIKEKFKPFIEITNEWEEKVYDLVVDNENQKDLIKKAREGRLILKKVRTESNSVRKALKEDSLKESKIIQDIFNKIKSLIEPMEHHLLNQELFVQLKEKKRIEELTSNRIEELEHYSEFVPFGLDLGTLSEEDYLKVLNGAKLQLKAKLENEKKIEAEKIEAEKIEKLRSKRALELQPYFYFMVENEKELSYGKMSEETYNDLKSNLKLRKVDYDKKIKKQEEDNKKLLSEKIKREAKAKKDKEISDKKIKAEKEKSKKLADELKSKKQKEANDKKAEQEKIKQQNLAPDKNKLELLAKEIDNMVFPTLSNKEAKVIEKNVRVLLNKVTTYIRDKSKEI